MGQKESRQEEQTFAKKLHEDFSRFPVCDEILTGKHVGPSDGTLMETPTVRRTHTVSECARVAW